MFKKIGKKQVENDPKKQYLDSADEDDDTFESEMTISTEHHAEQSTNPESKCSMKTYAPRNKYGGGVAILVKEGIEFIQDFSFDEFSSEIL
ncbi:hypothetical protein BpHYR1_035555 [Brachionus plicatilis]|uniref:Uncharacterized protein n=1 Tax=Brachionus plicatilis TaxID=10195 RepID=A0A3M7PZ72_BRAPC|nr:hypothetical protein BpHYR1_035555 [Brachionus plicatilis]